MILLEKNPHVFKNGNFYHEKCKIDQKSTEFNLDVLNLPNFEQLHYTASFPDFRKAYDQTGLMPKMNDLVKLSYASVLKQ